mmetsp:Transcript_36151/g.83903  ORF Transcript_36151/g.83903 Transcript_36151/m.83903 type:complete len:80 (+) Transcript_36151:928-1167(+)
MLEFDPSKRIDATGALAHPYMAELHDPEDEPCADSIFDFGFEKQQLTAAFIRDLIYEEVNYYKRRGQSGAAEGAADEGQ